MSSSTIARWSAIPMIRDSTTPSNKRPRSDAEHDSSDDNVSLISRSPSPMPEGVVEMKDISLYDEYVRGVAREVITVETKIKSTNKGFTMLAKMGWTEGTPLGISGEGRIDPIPFTVKTDSTGLGKVTQDVRMIEETVSQRRNLESERMQFETAEQRQQRETSVAQRAAVQSEISSVLRPFYCELCDKQFKNVAQYDEHTNSYAHHHKARMKDMNANHPMKVGGKEGAEKRKEKEKKREEKELRKMAKAAGIKMSAPAVMAGLPQLAGGESKGIKKSGWATVSSTAAVSVAASSASGAWASASTSSTAAPSSPFSSSSGSWAAVSSPAPPSAPRWQAAPPSSTPPPPPPRAAPGSHGFRSGGWSTLATSSSEPEAAAAASSSGFSRQSNQTVGSSNTVPPPPSAPSGARPSPLDTPPAPSSSSSWTRLADSNPVSTYPALPPTYPQEPDDAPGRFRPDQHAQASHKPDQDGLRGNWQRFQKMRGRR